MAVSVELLWRPLFASQRTTKFEHPVIVLFIVTEDTDRKTDQFVIVFS